MEHDKSPDARPPITGEAILRDLAQIATALAAVSRRLRAVEAAQAGLEAQVSGILDALGAIQRRAAGSVGPARSVN